MAFVTVLGTFHVTVSGSLTAVRTLGYRVVRVTATKQIDSPFSQVSPTRTPISSIALLAASILLLFLATIPFLKELQELRTVQIESLEQMRLGYNVSIRTDGDTQIDFYPGEMVKDAGLAKLKSRPNLTRVRLSSTGIRDEQLSVIGKLSNLETLLLDSTSITDNGLQHLKGLKNLRALYLKNSLVSDEAVSELQDSLPECFIDFPRENPQESR